MWREQGTFRFASMAVNSTQSMGPPQSLAVGAHELVKRTLRLVRFHSHVQENIGTGPALHLTAKNESTGRAWVRIAFTNR